MPFRPVLFLLPLLLLSCAPDVRPFLDGQDPNARLSFAGLTPKTIGRETVRLITTAEYSLRRILSLKPGQYTLAATVIALDDLQNGMWVSGAPLYLMGYTHPDAAVRKAALESVQRLERFSTDMFLDKRLYAVLLAFAGTPEGKALDGEYRKALDDTLRSMRRSGLSLPDNKLAEVKSLRNRLTKLGMDFSKNINESTGNIVLRGEAQTAGLPAQFLKARRQADGSHLVDLTYPSFFPFMNNARWAEGRKQLLTLYHQRAMGKNLPLLKDVLRLRRELVALLGYKNYAEYVLVERMAKNSAAVWDFLRRLEGKLAPHARKDLDLLTEYKRKETKDPAARLETWDVFYYSTRAREAQFQLDMDSLREYFPVPTVLDGLFRISQRLFGLDFRMVAGASVWHKDVRLYEVFDAKSGRLTGRFYLDLYPRPGKYGHAAMFSMIDGKDLGGGRYQIPTFALVCNFPRGTDGAPGLLSFDEVETFFHEFGHGLHSLLTETKLQVFAGTSVARDFVEMPSQFFENWIFLPDVLRSFAKHYKTGEPLPQKTVESLIRSRNFLAGYNNTKQLFYANYDMTLNDRFDPQQGTTALYAALHRRITSLSVIPETAPEASFGHLMGYAAGYYGYLWAKVYAQDVFSPFQDRGVDPVLGAKLRKDIFSRGGSEEPLVLLERFLGRKPREDAFLKTLGLGR